MKKLLKIVMILVAIALLVLLGMKAVKNKKAREASAPAAKIYPVVVQAMTPEVSNVTLTLPYLAESINEMDVTISSRIASRVESIKKSGERVVAGDVVARLDTTDLTAKIGAEKISLANLMRSHKRTQALYKVKGASIEQLQKEQTAIASLRASLKGLKNQLSYATLTAPISGVIAKSLAAEGDIAMPGKPLVHISAKKGFSLLIRTPEEISPKAVIYNNKEYKLDALNSTFNGLKEYKAYVNTEGLTSGDRVEVDVIVFEGNGIKLPFDAVLNREGKSYVLLAEGNRAIPREVHIIQSAQAGLVVSDKLEGKKIIVAKPDILLRLVSGYALKIKE
jgi:RND family efflux transporter MFP subunit